MLGPNSETEASADAKVVYLLGLSRSGTTLAGRILDKSDDNIDFAGEVLRVDDLGPGEVCSCGLSASLCPVWAEAAAYAKVCPNVRLTDVSLVTRTRLLLPRTLGRHNESFANRGADVSRILAFRHSGEGILVDSSKRVECLAALGLRDAWPDLTIWVTRDPGGVIASKMRRGLSSRWLGALTTVSVGMIRCALAFRSVPETRRMVVWYEDLVVDSQAMVTFVRSLLAPATVQSGRVSDRLRHEIGGTDYVEGAGQVRLDDRWRSEVPTWVKLVLAIWTPLLTGIISLISGADLSGKDEIPEIV